MPTDAFAAHLQGLGMGLAGGAALGATAGSDLMLYAVGSVAVGTQLVAYAVEKGGRES